MKTISDQQVIEQIRRQSPWWDGLGGIEPVVANYRRRDYLAPVLALVRDSSLRRAVVLMGPRRVGKTILIQHLIHDLMTSGIAPARIAYVAVDHPVLHGQSLESFVQLIERASPVTAGAERYLFFDEIQYLRDWQQHLKVLVDTRPDLRILVSGSAAAALSRQSRESGAGRFTDFLLPPLTFAEYLSLIQAEPAMRQTGENEYRLIDIDRLNRQFVDYVNYGGYPELALSPEARGNPGRFVRSDIVEKVLLRDLPTLYGITQIQELNALFTLLCYNTGEEVSLDNLSQACGMTKPTVTRYIEFLEAAFLLKRVFRVDQSGRRYQRERSFKIFLSNPAIRTGLYGPVESDQDVFGHLAETALFAQRFHEDTPLNYAGWSGAEVDMVELSPALKAVAATEIKWNDRYFERPADLVGLLKFCRSNGLAEGWCSTRTRFGERRVGEVEIVYWPTAALAFHFGQRAVRGRVAAFKAKLTAQID